VSASKSRGSTTGRAPIVLDTWALLAWLNREEPAATVVRGLLDEAESGRQQLVMSMVNAGEISYRSVGKR
jgi:predicted nucleic acid-binding protein